MCQVKLQRIVTIKRGVIVTFNIDDLLHCRITVLITTALHIDVLSYLGILHSVVEVAMAVREWLRKQIPIYSVVGI